MLFFIPSVCDFWVVTHQLETSDIVEFKKNSLKSRLSVWVQ